MAKSTFIKSSTNVIECITVTWKRNSSDYIPTLTAQNQGCKPKPLNHASHFEIESRPHITLFSSYFIEPAKLENIIKALAAKPEPLALSFSSIGSFPTDNNVLFLAPTPSVSLLQFQSQLCEAMKKEGVEIGEDYRTDSWMPYCAVAQDVPKSRMAEAFCVLRDLKLPVAGYAMDIGLVEFSPVRELFSFVLDC